MAHQKVSEKTTKAAWTSHQLTRTRRRNFSKLQFQSLTVLLWAARSQWPLQTFLCPRLKQKLSVKARLNPSSGKDTLKKNTHHPTIKFTAEISDKEITFLDTTVFKGDRFYENSVLDIRTHFKPTETFQYTHFSVFLSRTGREKLGFRRSV